MADDVSDTAVAQTYGGGPAGLRSAAREAAGERAALSNDPVPPAPSDDALPIKPPNDSDEPQSPRRAARDLAAWHREQLEQEIAEREQWANEYARVKGDAGLAPADGSPAGLDAETDELFKQAAALQEA